MAEVTWSRPAFETPPATFTLTLSEAEAVYVLAVLGLSNSVGITGRHVNVFSRLKRAYQESGGSTSRYESMRRIARSNFVTRFKQHYDW